MKRRKWMARLLAVAAMAVATTAWGGYNVWSNEYTLSQQQLQTAIESKFPARLRYAEVFTVDLRHPRLALNPTENRVVTTVSVSVQSQLPLVPLNGTIKLSSGLKYDSQARAIRLDNPTVDSIDFGELAAPYAQQLNEIGAIVAQRVLKDYPIYTFKPEQLRLNGKLFEPGAITVQADGIAVEVNAS